jgi:hypothetical protein
MAAWLAAGGPSADAGGLLVIETHHTLRIFPQMILDD